MFEVLRIRILGTQSAAKVTDKILNRLIQRDFGNQADNVKLKLRQITSDTHNGKNRISAAVIKLSNKNSKAIDYYINLSMNDFRDLISQAEYPRCSNLEFNEKGKQNMKRIYFDDWTDYSKWINE
jgi:hypothetical protein